ncbi:hypothetical protein AA14337_3220 [Acetobacter malorum DSM 14337]|uniref:Methyltransferase n=1 Tax=Acetobacter malorum DSM 14337 TaxID=1307910 RepID=A0ABQ0Q0C5_9PROT|nr:hypothetical protein [Acetobacter malorum]GBQ86020.1 hypothetical protein AA14337_3220 [Acetobacter malorum DSM 14337]
METHIEDTGLVLSHIPPKPEEEQSRRQFGSFRKHDEKDKEAGKADLYRTHPWVSRSILAREQFEGPVWECACGRGDVDRELRLLGYSTLATDLHDHGYGDSGRNFLESTAWSHDIMTNPPYNIGTKFIGHAVKIADGKLIFIVKLSFLEGAMRFCSIYYETPPSRIYVFSERPTFVESQEGLWPEEAADYESWLAAKGSMAGTMALVWDKRELRLPPGSGAETFWIAPGEKPKSKFVKRVRKMEEKHGTKIIQDLEKVGPFFAEPPPNRSQRAT